MIGSVFLKRDLLKVGDDGDFLFCMWIMQVIVVCSDLILVILFFLFVGFVSVL